MKKVWLVEFSNGEKVITKTKDKALELALAYMVETFSGFLSDNNDEDEMKATYDLMKYVDELKASYNKKGGYFECDPFVRAFKKELA